MYPSRPAIASVAAVQVMTTVSLQSVTSGTCEVETRLVGPTGGVPSTYTTAVLESSTALSERALTAKVLTPSDAQRVVQCAARDEL